MRVIEHDDGLIDYSDEPCPYCDGAGGFHDCGEDVCCCEFRHGEAEDLDWWDCPHCLGEG